MKPNPLLKISECLRKWDPIGVLDEGSDCPPTEYDSYAPAIVKMLARGADADAIAAHLNNLARENIGVCCGLKKSLEIAREMADYWQNE
jgi:hypothetical protein